ncbi:MAG: HEAT repeat domain-containing protein, partial [Planctomycetota bacterium]
NLDDWREWWKRNEWRFTRVASKKIQVTGQKEGEEGEKEAWHLKTMREFLLEALEDRHTDVRSSAAIALGKLGKGEEAVRVALERLTKDSHADVQVSAVLALGMLKIRESAPFLVKILNTTKAASGLRAAAAVSLGQMQDPEHIPLLARRGDRAKEKKTEVRMGAILGLGLIRNEGCAHPLWSVLQGRDKDEVRGMAASALAKLGVETIALRSGSKKKRFPLHRILENLLGNRKTKSEIRRSVALALGMIGDAKSVAALKRAVQRDQDKAVRAFSMISLAELRARPLEGEKIQEFLVRCGEAEQDRDVRPYVFLALGITKDPSGGAVLRRGFLEGNNQERGAAALGLGMIRDEGSVTMLGAELDEPKTAGDARWYCCQALGMIGNREAAERLRWALDNLSTPYLQAAVCKGLAILGDRSAVPSVIKNLESRNQVVRTWAARSLGYFRDISTIPRLIEFIKSEKVEEVRALAIVSLGIIGEVAEKMPVLREISDHCNWTVSQKFPAVALILRLI